MPTELEKAYIAGLFDGEGAVSILSSNTFAARLEIANTNLEVLEYVHSLFGGSITERLKVERCKQSYVWYLTKRVDVLVFVEAILPHSRIKRERLLLLRDFLTIARNGEGREGVAKGRHYTEDENLQRAIKVVQIKALNKRGD